MLKRVLGWGAVGGLMIALLRVIEYKHFVQQYSSSEVYGTMVAAMFTAIGIYVGLRLVRPQGAVVPGPAGEAPAAPQPAADPTPFVRNEASLREIGLTQREHEILVLISEGLSNREIGERLFVSEKTVKTHSSRVFQKMQVNRRVQAVQRARELGLIP